MPFLKLHLAITVGQITTYVYNKTDSFGFCSIRFPQVFLNRILKQENDLFSYNKALHEIMNHN